MASARRRARPQAGCAHLRQGARTHRDPRHRVGCWRRWRRRSNGACHCCSLSHHRRLRASRSGRTRFRATCATYKSSRDAPPITTRCSAEVPREPRCRCQGVGHRAGPIAQDARRRARLRVARPPGARRPSGLRGVSPRGALRRADLAPRLGGKIVCEKPAFPR